MTEMTLPADLYDTALRALFDGTPSGRLFETEYSGATVTISASESATSDAVLDAWRKLKEGVFMTRSLDEVELDGVADEAARALGGIQVKIQRETASKQFHLAESVREVAGTHFVRPSRLAAQEILAMHG